MMKAESSEFPLNDSIEKGFNCIIFWPSIWPYSSTRRKFSSTNRSIRLVVSFRMIELLLKYLNEVASDGTLKSVE